MRSTNIVPDYEKSCLTFGVSCVVAKTSLQKLFRDVSLRKFLKLRSSVHKRQKLFKDINKCEALESDEVEDTK